MILGTDHQAAVRRLADLSCYLGELDDARRTAAAVGMDDHANDLAKMIRSAQIACQDTQAVISLYERQESGRSVTRQIRDHAHRQIEQLILQPQAAVL